MSETKLAGICKRCCGDPTVVCPDCNGTGSAPDPRIAAADAMAKALESILPEDEDWWCPTCKESLGGSRVTHSECCDTCGTYLGGIAAPEWLQSARAALAAYNALK